MSDMNAIQIARRMAELGQEKEACQAYTLAIADTNDPEIQFEAALYILQNGGNYQVSYDVLLGLYQDPDYRQDAFSILTGAFYELNEKQMKTRYEKNCKLLQKYPYLFQKNFPKFEDLPIRFYPFDDTLYVPFDSRTEKFNAKVNINHPQITHYFFKDLSKPIFAEDIYSQYELEYLWDNVRASEDIAKENHIYLHYTCWEEFCSYLQVLNVRTLLNRKKVVFLIDDEIARYPIDFQKEYGIDYAKFTLKPPALSEYRKLIWHTQLSSDNGGDFFNEVFDRHPNMIMMHSMMLDEFFEMFQKLKDGINNKNLTVNIHQNSKIDDTLKLWILQNCQCCSGTDDRELFAYLFLLLADVSNLDIHSRIVPAIFFQPHFSNIDYAIISNSSNRANLHSEQYDQIVNNPVFRRFKYIKTFTPMRRFTTSEAAMIRFQSSQCDVRFQDDVPAISITEDGILTRILNRSYMVDWQNRLFQDSRVVRFEDGKLNPKATFTALAEFLDVPYTESMTYCSLVGEKNPESFPGNARGFSTDVVYRTYDEYLGTPERYLTEYFLQDAYRYYGYDFQWYDGQKLTYADIQKKSAEIEILDQIIEKSIRTNVPIYNAFIKEPDNIKKYGKLSNVPVEEYVINQMAHIRNVRLSIFKALMHKLYFVNENGQSLNFMPLLRLDPELMEAPLYH